MPTNTHDPFGDFRPVVPSIIRLLAGIIVLIVVQSIVLGFPGITTQIVPGTAFSIASFVIFTLGLIVAAVVLKYGKQLPNFSRTTTRTKRPTRPIWHGSFNWTPLTFLKGVVRTWSGT